MTPSQDPVREALRRAFSLGQTYWQQADSDYTSQHKKADITRAKFDALVEETCAARAAPARPQAGDAVREALERMSTLLEEHIRRHPFGNNVLVVQARNHAQAAIAQLQEKNDG